jgi:hypothetical protein
MARPGGRLVAERNGRWPVVVIVHAAILMAGGATLQLSVVNFRYDRPEARNLALAAGSANVCGWGRDRGRVG